MNNIEILEHIAIAYIDDEEFSQYVSPEGRFITNKQLAKAIENLIQENKELKERLENRRAIDKELEIENKSLLQVNKELKEKVNVLNQEKEYLNTIIESDNDNYIPKSKVKEKIEELEKQEDWFIENKGLDELYGQIDILKELLEGE